MRWLIGSFVFSVAFLSGLFAVGMSFVGGLSDCVVRSSAEEVLEQPRLVPSRPVGGVMVLYAGLDQDWDSRGFAA